MTEEQVRSALREVVDPELGINVVDLGLVYSIEVESDHVRIAMTMTTPACPVHAYLAETVERALREQGPDVRSVRVDLVWEPPWDPAMMSESAKRQLGWMG
jgi:metal-sulfur cluster biosynthetic enzyme